MCRTSSNTQEVPRSAYIHPAYGPTVKTLTRLHFNLTYARCPRYLQSTFAFVVVGRLEDYDRNLTHIL